MEKGLKLLTKSLVVNESTFRQLVGSLIYLSTTRLDLSYAVSDKSRFMTTPKAKYWVLVKHVLRYVKGTLDFSILYNKINDPQLIGFYKLRLVRFC